MDERIKIKVTCINCGNWKYIFAGMRPTCDSCRQSQLSCELVTKLEKPQKAPPMKPSEKAINFEELAQLIFYKCCYEHEGQVKFKTGIAAYDLLKPAFDEALAEHQRVIDMAEKAIKALIPSIGSLREHSQAEVDVVDEALAAITKLKGGTTNPRIDKFNETLRLIKEHGIYEADRDPQHDCWTWKGHNWFYSTPEEALEAKLKGAK